MSNAVWSPIGESFHLKLQITRNKYRVKYISYQILKKWKEFGNKEFTAWNKHYYFWIFGSISVLQSEELQLSKVHHRSLII